MKKLAHIMIAVFMGLLATACAQKEIPPPFAPTDLNAKVSHDGYVRKVDNFIVIFDDTESMYLDRLWQSKLDKAKLVAHNMNNTIPTLDLQAGMRVFGPRSYSMADGSAPQYGMTAYTQAGLGDAINAVTTTGGNTPMTRAIELATADLAASQGPIAVILISDGEENIKVPAVVAARALKEKYGDRVCIYTILIGDSAEGRVVLAEIAQVGGCGFATDEEALSTPAGMADFVEKVFLRKGEKVAAVAPPSPPPPPMPEPTPMAEKKCFTVELKVEFDFDKSFIRSKYFKTLTEFGDFMGKYPNHTVNLEGNTDNFGTDQYNQKLGQRRAESVREFLLKYFTTISPARLTAISHGEAKPVATNESKEGRQRNRRVFATFTYCEK
jgi:OOP family OmpA-OmpF porin